jgi:ribosomal protein L37AE/L43A
MKPITKAPEEEIARLIEEKVSPLGDKLNEISEKLTKEGEKPREKKIEEIIRKIREKTVEKIVKDREKLKEEMKEVHDKVDCPTCGVGHVHKVIGNGLTLKCTGDKCGEEFVMVSKSADHACRNCGFPLKKPSEGKKLNACPFCGTSKGADIFEKGKPQLKFDFTKMKK